MATDKKNDKERSVEERLQNLFQLQSYLSEIDRIKILRGELPNEVKDLEDEIIRYQTRIQKYKDEIEDLKAFVNQKKGEIADRRVKIEKYEEQINNVRNNREFAFLEKEKEFEGLEKSSLRKTSERLLKSRSRKPLKYSVQKRVWPTISTSSRKSAKNLTKLCRKLAWRKRTYASRQKNSNRKSMTILSPPSRESAKMLATGLASSLCREVPAEAASTAFPRNASLK